MAILPYNFENQAITAAGLAAALRALLADGPLHGCAIGFDGATVSIAPGRIIIGGYVFRLVRRGRRGRSDNGEHGLGRCAA